MPQDTITVRILEGRNLLAADRGGTSDPYAVVRVDNTKHKTKIIKKCLNPKWMETFKFPVQNPKTTKVVIEVWDKDTFKKDDPLGCISLPVSNLEKGVEKLEWYNLNGVPKGQIQVGITADNFDSAQQNSALKSNYPSSSVTPPIQYPTEPSTYSSYPQTPPAYPPTSVQHYSTQPNFPTYSSQSSYPPPVNYPPQPVSGYPQGEIYPQVNQVNYGSQPNYPPQPTANQYPPQVNYPPQPVGAYPQTNSPYSSQTSYDYGSQPNYPPQPQVTPVNYGSQPNYPPQPAANQYPPQVNYPPQPIPGYPQANSPYSSQPNYPPQGQYPNNNSYLPPM